MGIIVGISQVSDGSMLDRTNTLNPEVLQNRRVYLDALGITVANTTRVCVTYQREDFLRYFLVNDDIKNHGMTDDAIPVADMLVTVEKDQALFLGIADCVAAVLYDPINKVLGVAHLGRHSLEQQGGQKAVEFFVKNHRSRPQDIKVWLSPAPSKDNYKIWKLDDKGMKEATFEQLYAAGITAENIIDNPAETDKDLNYFSYSEFLKGNRHTDGDHAIVAMMTD